MSRSVYGNNNNNNSIKSLLPPSHPAEQLPDHRAFLMRSLDRNDSDLAALQELHRSLRSVKQAILQLPAGHGARVLLQLGQGVLLLCHENDTLIAADDTKNEELLPKDMETRNLCVDFLLRLKLRRKLLNRLSRRLSRIASAMDGNDVNPPLPPRYGDLRLHIDPNSVLAFAEHHQRYEKARLQLERVRETKLMTEEDEEEEDEEEEEEASKQDKEDSVKEKAPEETKAKEEGGDGEQPPIVVSGSSAAAAAPPPVEDGAAVPALAVGSSSSIPATAVAPLPIPSSNPPEEEQQQEAQQQDAAMMDQQDDIHNIDYDALKDYDDAYEKRIVHHADGDDEAHYTLLDDQPNGGDAAENQDNNTAGFDFTKIRFGAGIGATHRSMSAKEKVLEFQKWQQMLLSRIPEQPTFAELGLQHRVFLLEARMKRAIALEEKEAKEEARKKAKREAEEKDEDSDNDSEDDDEEEEDVEKERAEGGENKNAKQKEKGEAKSGTESNEDMDKEDGDEEEMRTEKGQDETLKDSGRGKDVDKMDVDTAQDEKEDKRSDGNDPDTIETVDTATPMQDYEIDKDQEATQVQEEAKAEEQEGLTVEENKEGKSNDKTQDVVKGEQIVGVMAEENKEGKSNDETKDVVKGEQEGLPVEENREGKSNDETKDVVVQGAEANEGDQNQQEEDKGEKDEDAMQADVEGDESNATKEKKMEEGQGVLEQDTNIDGKEEDKMTEDADLNKTAEKDNDAKTEKADQDKDELDAEMEDVAKAEETVDQDKEELDTKMEEDELVVTTAEKPTDQDEEEPDTEMKTEEKADATDGEAVDKEESDTEEDENDGAKAEETADKDIEETDTEKEEEEEEKVDKEESDSEKEDAEEKSPSKEEEKKEETKAKEAVPKKPVKPISLAAVPTFYEQDLMRIKNVHAELMIASIHDHARRRLEEVTKAYNSALRKSTDLNARREHIEANLQQFAYQNRNIWNDQKVKAAVAKNNWIRGRQQFEHDKLNKMLPTRHGNNPVGTPMTQRYGARPEPVYQLVAHCVADIVDAVELVAYGKVTNPKYPVPPPAADAETLAQVEHAQRTESRLRNELNIIQTKLRGSEEERHRAWKKMLKTKSELLPNVNNYAFPLPNLRQSLAERVPHEVMAAARASLPSYIPAARSRAPVVPTSRVPSESLYSAARVRERISDDGTVAPVSEPKKTADGLYLRPAGRTRKGMEWDAIRGIWVPRIE